MHSRCRTTPARSAGVMALWPSRSKSQRPSAASRQIINFVASGSGRGSGQASSRNTPPHRSRGTGSVSMAARRWRRSLPPPLPATSRLLARRYARAARPRSSGSASASALTSLLRRRSPLPLGATWSEVSGAAFYDDVPRPRLKIPSRGHDLKRGPEVPRALAAALVHRVIIGIGLIADLRRALRLITRLSWFARGETMSAQLYSVSFANQSTRLRRTLVSASNMAGVP